MIIKIDDGTNEIFEMNNEIAELEASPWIVLNTREIGVFIAYNLFDAEYDITEEILDEEINDFLSNVHQKIIDNAINVLNDNGINVY